MSLVYWSQIDNIKIVRTPMHHLPFCQAVHKKTNDWPNLLLQLELLNSRGLRSATSPVSYHGITYSSYHVHIFLSRIPVWKVRLWTPLNNRPFAILPDSLENAKNWPNLLLLLGLLGSRGISSATSQVWYQRFTNSSSHIVNICQCQFQSVM